VKAFHNGDGGIVVTRMIAVIQGNKDYLSEVDGAIGDGDHGVNMNKGFTLAGERLTGNESLSESFDTLGNVLLEEIGGSMGPLYGSFFIDMGDAISGKDFIDQTVFGEMLSAGLQALHDISPGGDIGDKTIFDTLIPAVRSFERATEEGASYEDALKISARAAEKGRDATKDMVAKVGRASRLGERSRGTIDAGATSCALILRSLCDTVEELLFEQ
jgi:dihydroxyacetone kinase-like protein